MKNEIVSFTIMQLPKNDYFKLIVVQKLSELINLLQKIRVIRT